MDKTENSQVELVVLLVFTEGTCAWEKLMASSLENRSMKVGFQLEKKMCTLQEIKNTRG